MCTRLNVEGMLNIPSTFKHLNVEAAEGAHWISCKHLNVEGMLKVCCKAAQSEGKLTNSILTDFPTYGLRGSTYDVGLEVVYNINFRNFARKLQKI